MAVLYWLVVKVSIFKGSSDDRLSGRVDTFIIKHDQGALESAGDSSGRVAAFTVVPHIIGVSTGEAKRGSTEQFLAEDRNWTLVIELTGNPN